MKPSRIVIATIGSLGDLHPYIALAIGLKERGHAPVLVTSEMYCQKIQREGIEFVPAPPDIGDVENESEFMRNVMDRFRGTTYVVGEVVLPHLRENHKRLLAASRNADLLIGHPLTYAVPIIAEQLGLKWMGTCLQPMVFLSAHDPPSFGPLPWLGQLPFGPSFHRTVLKGMKGIARWMWAKPVEQLRRDCGLGPAKFHPLLDGLFSEHGNLALFSKHFASPQPDWPARTTIPGFLFHDKGHETHHDQLSVGLRDFLQAGEPPVVFTLGSSAVMTAGSFYRESFHAAKNQRMRAVLLIGKDERNRPREPIPDHIYIEEYAPYSQLFPHSRAVVHQGGVGTMAQVLRAGKPMVIVPFSHDQPDHAYRIGRLGCGLSITRSGYRSKRIAKLLERLQQNSFQETAAEIGKKIRAEDGVQAACDTIESVLQG